MSEPVPISSFYYDDAGPHVANVPAALAARSSKLQSLLEAGIRGLTPLDTTPFSKPADIVDDSVPIEDLLYKGTSAITRAIEIRDEITRRAGAPQPGELEELFALLDLAKSS